MRMIKNNIIPGIPLPFHFAKNIGNFSFKNGVNNRPIIIRSGICICMCITIMDSDIEITGGSIKKI